MSLRVIAIVVVIIILAVLVSRNKAAIRSFLGTKGVPNKIDPNKFDPATVDLSDTQGTIDQMLAQIAEGNADGSLSEGDELALQKKIQILKLQQKTGVQFNQKGIKELMKMTLAQLKELNSFTLAELQGLYALYLEGETAGGDSSAYGSLGGYGYIFESIFG